MTDFMPNSNIPNDIITQDEFKAYCKTIFPGTNFETPENFKERNSQVYDKLLNFFVTNKSCKYDIKSTGTLYKTISSNDNIVIGPLSDERLVWFREQCLDPNKFIKKTI